MTNISSSLVAAAVLAQSQPKTALPLKFPLDFNLPSLHLNAALTAPVTAKVVMSGTVKNVTPIKASLTASATIHGTATVKAAIKGAAAEGCTIAAKSTLAAKLTGTLGAGVSITAAPKAAYQIAGKITAAAAVTGKATLAATVRGAVTGSASIAAAAELDAAIASIIGTENLMPTAVAECTGGVGSFYSGAISANNAEQGRPSFRVDTLNNNYPDGFITTQTQNLVNGQTYTYSLLAWIPEGEAVTFSMRQVTGGGGYNPVTVSGTGDWQNVAVSFTVANDNTSGMIQGYQTNNTDVFSFWIADLQLENLPYQTPFADGTRPDGRLISTVSIAGTAAVKIAGSVAGITASATISATAAAGASVSASAAVSSSIQAAVKLTAAETARLSAGAVLSTVTVTLSGAPRSATAATVGIAGTLSNAAALAAVPLSGTISISAADRMSGALKSGLTAAVSIRAAVIDLVGADLIADARIDDRPYFEFPFTFPLCFRGGMQADYALGSDLTAGADITNHSINNLIGAAISVSAAISASVLASARLSSPLAAKAGIQAKAALSGTLSSDVSADAGIAGAISDNVAVAANLTAAGAVAAATAALDGALQGNFTAGVLIRAAATKFIGADLSSGALITERTAFDFPLTFPFAFRDGLQAGYSEKSDLTADVVIAGALANLIGASLTASPTISADARLAAVISSSMGAAAVIHAADKLTAGITAALVCVARITGDLQDLNSLSGRVNTWAVIAARATVKFSLCADLTAGAKIENIVVIELDGVFPAEAAAGGTAEFKLRVNATIGMAVFTAVFPRACTAAAQLGVPAAESGTLCRSVARTETAFGQAATEKIEKTIRTTAAFPEESAGSGADGKNMPIKAEFIDLSYIAKFTGGVKNAIHNLS